MKTLVVAPNWIGDALMAQPLLTLLKRADPSQKIVVLAPHWVAPVLDAMPEVEQVVATALAHGSLQWNERRALARTLASERFDRAFVLPNSFKSALIPWLARIPQRIGYFGESRYGLVNRRAAGPDPALSMSARYAALAGMVGCAVETPLPLPRLIVDFATISEARHTFGLAPNAPLIALCPGAEYGPAKRWPAEHFADLATRLLADDPEVAIVLLGGPGDRELAAAVVSGARVDADRERLHDLTGRTSLAEAIALIASATVIGNDSGLMHVAAALERPQVAIFGSSDPRHTPPLSARAKVLWLHLDCSPCFERTCPLGHLNCLVDITPESVFDSMQNNPSRHASPH